MEIFSFGDYGGGFWDFYECVGQLFYFVLILKFCYCLFCEGNGFEGEVLCDVIGIIVMFFVFLYFFFCYDDDEFVEGYGCFYEYVVDYLEVVVIFQVID